MNSLRYLMTILAGAALAVASLADSITIDGVKIDGPDVKDVIVATKFPVTVTAPAGGALYRWDVPAGVKAKRLRGQVLTIDDAPPGELTLTVDYAVADFDAKTLGEKTASVTFTVGGVGPPPVPPQPPVDPVLVQSLQAAYAADIDTLKAARLPKLADLMANVVAVARASGTVKTAKQFADAVHDATETLFLHQPALGSIRLAIGAYVQTQLPRDPATPTTDSYWTQAATAYANVAAALKAVK